MARTSPFEENDPLLPFIVVVGTPGDDNLEGSGEDDRLVGRRGNDNLTGLAGDDRLIGGRGLDELRGGPGDDLLRGGANADELYGDEGDDVLRGGSGRDRLEGEAGNDALFGGGGRDFLRGGSGSDLLIGGRGVDELVGRSGFDRLDGGRGFDSLAGGPNSDVFQFTVLDGKLDRITDFEVPEETSQPDSLDLSALVPISTTDANLGDFVRQTERADGKLIEVRPAGSAEFVELALITRTDIDDLSALQLGLDDIPGDLSTDASLQNTGTAAAASRVQQPGDQDWFRIELLPERDYSFDLLGATDLDGNLFPNGLSAPVLELRAADGSLLRADTDGGTAARLTLVNGSFDPGTHFLVARGSDDLVGGYTLSSTAEFIPSDPGQLAIGGARQGAITQDDQVDLYRLDLAAGDHVDVVLQSLEDPDPDATLLVASLMMLVTDPAGGAAGASVDLFHGGSGDRVVDAVAIDAASAGTYTIEVDNLFDVALPDGYRVSVARDAPDSFSDAGTAPFLGFDAEIAAAIGPDFDDVDWYRVDLQAGNSYRFELAGSRTGEGSLSNPGLELRTAGDDLVASGSAQILFDAPTSGTFFLVAAGVANRGSYTIRAMDLGPTEMGGESLGIADVLAGDGASAALSSPPPGPLAEAGQPNLGALLTAPDPAQAATG
jgi:hypothetical protein